MSVSEDCALFIAVVIGLAVALLGPIVYDLIVRKNGRSPGDW